jgi:pimeloyl-ACP methyl ester carboxylesterase
VVFVHGAWHGAWCFSPVIQHLAAAGVQTLATDLPGHGTDAAFPSGYFETPQNLDKLTQAPSPLAAFTADDYQKHLTMMIAGLVAKGSGPVVLVGHSLGGVTLNRIGEASPQLIRRLVYLTALNPVSKPAAGDYFSQPAMQTSKALPLFIGDPAKTGAIRFNHRADDAAFKAAAKAAFYADVSDDRFAAVTHLLTPDEPAAVFGANATVTAARWGRVPRTYIRCTDDQAIPLAAQNQFIAEADALTPRNRYSVRTLKASHSPFISMPKELARLLVESLV